MLVELSYIALSLVLVVWCAWLYVRGKSRSRLYLITCFAFLTLSTIFQALNSMIWINRITSTLLEVGGLAFFAGFIIMAIIAINDIFKEKSDS